MPQYTIRTFGVAREIMGGKEIVVEITGQTVATLRKELIEKFPRLAGLRSFFIAVNHAYAEDIQLLTDTDEIAVIPPVSGG